MEDDSWMVTRKFTIEFNASLQLLTWHRWTLMHVAADTPHVFCMHTCYTGHRQRADR